jgi:hypothetical protein
VRTGGQRIVRHAARLAGSNGTSVLRAALRPLST